MYFESDEDEDDLVLTKPRGRKAPAHDSPRKSLNDLGPASPLRTGARLVANNDFEEKRKRRQSVGLAIRKARKSILGVQMASSPHKPVAAVEEAPPLPGLHLLSEEEISMSYMEWMKICTDNKINASNTWNVALIDYFHDLALFRDGDSINFQKASCTLDGCLKVYSSRVDSVSSETNKLLLGLSNAQEDAPKNDGADGDDDEEAANERQQKKKKAVRAGYTLEASIENLNVKKFDTELSGDPLFKKTCAEFDEGGASSLLLNTLPTDGRARVIFDSSDVPAMTVSGTATSLDMTAMNDMVQLLRDRFGHMLTSLDKLKICPTFHNYRFTATSGAAQALPSLSDSTTAALQDSADGADDDDDDMDDLAELMEDRSFTDLGVEPGGFGGDMDGPLDSDGDDDGDDESVRGMPRESDVGNPQATAYFGTEFQEPEHWRLRRQFVAGLQGNTARSTAPATKRRARVPFVVPFTSEEPPISAAKLFAAGTAAAMYLGARSRGGGFLLPDVADDDKAVTPKDLMTLFTRPSWVNYKGGRSGGIGTATGPVRPSEESSALNTTMGIGNMSMMFDDDDDDDDGFAPDTTLLGMNQTGPSDFGSDLVARPKLIKKMAIGFAKTAKKVDVKKLKENIWTKMNDTIVKVEESGQETQVEPLNEESEQPFSSVMSTLRDAYPEKRLKDISVSFCFICLLHLANENNLAIRGAGDLSELFVRQN